MIALLDLSGLHAPLADGALRLDPLADRHRAALQAACAADEAIWDIYYNSWGPGHFDAQFDALLTQLPAKVEHRQFGSQFDPDRHRIDEQPDDTIRAFDRRSTAGPRSASAVSMSRISAA